LNSRFDILNGATKMAVVVDAAWREAAVYAEISKLKWVYHRDNITGGIHCMHLSL
jgi:hypothetical protein